jgi:hypothetical protein
MPGTMPGDLIPNLSGFVGAEPVRARDLAGTATAGEQMIAAAEAQSETEGPTLSKGRAAQTAGVASCRLLSSRLVDYRIAGETVGFPPPCTAPTAAGSASTVPCDLIRLSIK